MSLRLPADLAAELAAVARADGMTISDAVREAVGKHIGERRADPDFQERLKERPPTPHFKVGSAGAWRKTANSWSATRRRRAEHGTNRCLVRLGGSEARNRTSC
jgi:predicted DNA-binding protein